jgi:hypothetical protein
MTPEEHERRKRQGQEALEFLAPVLNDPDFLIRSDAESYKETGNPFFAWEAVTVCSAQDKPFPDWVRAYLADCANRMTSPEAAAGGHDLRKVLPWIFGFPIKRGPGNLLNPTKGAEELCEFAYNFAFRVMKGEPPTSAIRDACNEAFTGAMAEVDDKTLQRALRHFFKLKKWPAGQAQWRKGFY